MAGHHGPMGWAACLVQTRNRVSVRSPSEQPHTQTTGQISLVSHSLDLALGPMSHQFLLGSTFPLVQRRRRKWTKPAHPTYPGPVQGLIHAPSYSALTPTPHSFPRKWKFHKQGRGYSCLSRTVAFPSPTGRCSNHGNVRKAGHTLNTHGHAHTERHVPCGDVLHTCTHTDTCTQRNIHTCLSTQRCAHSKTHTQDMHSHISGKKGGNQPDVCAREVNPVSCSSGTHQSLQGCAEPTKFSYPQQTAPLPLCLPPRGQEHHTEM